MRWMTRADVIFLKRCPSTLFSSTKSMQPFLSMSPLFLSTLEKMRKNASTRHCIDPIGKSFHHKKQQVVVEHSWCSGMLCPFLFSHSVMCLPLNLYTSSRQYLLLKIILCFLVFREIIFDYFIHM